MASETQDDRIETHLYRLNKNLRKTGARRWSFNRYALEAIEEKIARDEQGAE